MRVCPSIAPLLAVLFLASAQAQSLRLIDAPTPGAGVASSRAGDPYASIQAAPTLSPMPTLHAFDWAAIAGGGALRVLDYTTTEKALSYPQYFHEDVLPSALVHSKAGFAAFQAATVGADYAAYRYLVHHNLRTMAAVGQYLYDSAMLFQVASNYQTLGKVHLN